jgi:nitrite reductase (NADH) small subunit
MNEKWVRITNSDNIPLRQGRVVKANGIDIAIFNLGDRFLAVLNRCPHQGGPLADGIISGTSVVCPLHAWKVDLESGAVARPTDSGQCVRVFQTRVDGGVVMLNLADLQLRHQCDSMQQKSALQQDATHAAVTPSA